MKLKSLKLGQNYPSRNSFFLPRPEITYERVEIEGILISIPKKLWDPSLFYVGYILNLLNANINLGKSLSKFSKLPYYFVDQTLV